MATADLYRGNAHHAAKLTRFFGTNAAFGTGNPNPGDMLTFFNHGKNEIDHVANNL